MSRHTPADGTTAHASRRRIATGVALAATGALTAGLITGPTAAPGHGAAPTLGSEPYGSLSQALQMSLYFYDAEMSGASRSEDVQRLEWRGDSEVADGAIPMTSGGSGTSKLADVGTNLTAAMISQYGDILDPDGDGTIDVSGGYHDAGDHVKFGLPQAYSAATLGWGLYEFKDAYVATGSYDAIMTHLRWFSDYFLRSTFRDSSGAVVAFNYMVGRGSVDHTYWGSPELQDPTKFPRPATFAYVGAPASDQVAGTAAALSVMALNTTTSDPTYSAECLDTAQALYAFARANRGTGNGDGFYPSSFDDDEMAWAATWLYEATGTASYLDDIVAQDASGNYTGYLRKIINSPGDNWQNIWVHSWDTVWGGVFAKLAPLTKGVVPDKENQKYWYYFRWNAEYWTGGAVQHRDTNDGNYIATSPAGFSVVSTWGSARYNTAAQLCALVYRKYSALDWGDAAANKQTGVELSEWALSQMNYIMGDNPLSRSYIVGFTANSTDTYASHPHHRAAHGSSTNSMLVPAAHKHTLWGALVGGPDASDAHKDETTDYVYNEVAIDYNAAFVGALAGLYEYFGQGQTVTTWTPKAEAAENPYFVNAKIEQETNQRTQVTVAMNNTVTHPPALVDDLSARYYFDISELQAKGQSISDVTIEVYYDEAKTLTGEAVTITGPTAVDAAGGLYFITLSWDGIAFYGKRELQFGLIAAQDSTWKDNWDGTNDYSHTGLTSTALAATDHIPVYRDGVLVDGVEPAVEPAPVDPTPTPADKPTCSAAMVLSSSWATGYQAVVTVTAGSSAVNSWTTAFTLPSGAALADSWSAMITGSSPAFTAASTSSNSRLGAGASTTYGFVASGTAPTATVPVSCTAT